MTARSRGRRRRVVASGGAALALGTLALLTLSAAGSAEPAAAATQQPVGQLTVDSDRGSPAVFTGFTPGTSSYWRVTPSVTGAPANLDLRVTRGGALALRADGLRLAVALCSVTWSQPPQDAAPTCAGTATSILVDTALASAAFDAPVSLGRVPDGAPLHLLLTFSLPDDAATASDDSLMAQTASLGVDVIASGVGSETGPGDPSQTVAPTAPGGVTGGNSGGAESSGASAIDSTVPFSQALAWTGSNAEPLAAIGVVVIALGTALFMLSRRRLRARPRPRDL